MTDVVQHRPADLGEADRALKAKHAALWALGDYPAVATDLIAELGPILVAAARVQPGDSVLDVAAGAGNVAIPAARAGARVVACDLTPELLEVGRQHARDAGVEITWATQTPKPCCTRTPSSTRCCPAWV